MAKSAVVTTNTNGNVFLDRVYAVQSPDDCQKIYDDWSETFESDVTSPEQDYVAPRLLANALLAAGANMNGEILDAGCGTGLGAVALANVGAKTIDGVDFSSGMLKVAQRTGLYRSLAQVDLTREIPDQQDESYDVVTCLGTLTHGHVGPVPALGEFVRITKRNGIIAATVLDDIWQSGGYEAEVKRLQSEGFVEVLSTENADYRKAAGVKARILVLKKRL